MTTDSVIFEQKGAIALVTINRPKALNALNSEVIDSLQNIVDNNLNDKAIRACILQSTGDKAFVAGADIKQMAELTADQARDFAKKGQKLTRSLEKLAYPVIAKVQGFALGGGCELAMACDIIVASENAKFGQPEVGLGLIAGFGGTKRLCRRLGFVTGMDILTSGLLIDGKRASELGLVSRCVPAEKLDEEIGKVINGILKGEPSAIAFTKQLARSYLDETIDKDLEKEADSFMKCFEGQPSREGMNAFIERRKPGFSDSY